MQTGRKSRSSSLDGSVYRKNIGIDAFEQWLENILLRIADTNLNDLASLLPNAWKQPE